jgi:iron complex outermembrane receptor protein
MRLNSGHFRENLVGTAVRRTLLAAAIAAGGALPTVAFAQEAPATKDQAMEEVVVTGSILRRTDAETPSPVTVLSADTLAERGINTVSEAIQRLSANNAGTIQQGWNTGFNFAAGANAPALRGLTVQATLSVADGLRLAPYPLADDGHRNFVDLNTIPNAIVERIEVLRDGASSTYGADAIAGVINVITKKEIQGLHIGGSTGLSEDGGGDENRIDLTWGYGDLESQGFNFYVSGEYQKQDPLWARDRGYPFNTQDWSRKCGASGSCMHNLNWNGVSSEDGNYNGLFSTPGVTLVRPADGLILDGTGSVAGGVAQRDTNGNLVLDANGNVIPTRLRYQYLNPGAGCREFNTVALSAAQQGTSSPASVCEVNFQSKYIMLQPEISRQGISSRFTANVGENSQFYMMANFYKTDTAASFTPLGFNGLPTVPRPQGMDNYNVILPVYVCSTGKGTIDGANTGCTAANGTLNPYNPFAGEGLRAQVNLRSPYGRTEETSSRALRGVVGIEGSFADSWRYSADFTASEVGLDRDEGNYFIPQRIMDVVARGTFNFSDPYANDQETWDYIAPKKQEHHTSRLWQVQGTVSKEIVDLPGGPLQAAVGLSYREEELTQNSANPPNDSAPYERYYSINAVGAAGERTVKSGFFEISAPVLESLEFMASGRYDEYSSGQSNFSPKVGFKFTPIEQIAVRGTWSEGFRIPSFNEAYGLPTTGYVTATVNCTTAAAYCAAHGNNAYATNPYSVGLTSVGNPELDPEESTSFTAGLVIEPMSNLSFTIDYWNIEVDGLIKGVTAGANLINQWYTTGGDPGIPGIVMLPGAPDPANPNAQPQLGFIQASFANLESQKADGIDIGANLSLPIGDSVTWRSSLDASYMMKFEQIKEDGTVQRYDGTLSPCDVTSCSGTPKWRGSWQNTFEFGATSVSLTAYYTSGYDTASVDYDGVKGDCEGNAANAISTATYADGTPVNCTQPAQWNADLTARHTFNDKYTVFAEVLNVLDIEPEFDPSAAYALFGFNPAWGGPNIMGRYFRVGVKLDF